jgi:hypothetical protein
MFMAVKLALAGPPFAPILDADWARVCCRERNQQLMKSSSGTKDVPRRGQIKV